MKVLVIQVRQALVCTAVEGCVKYPECFDVLGACYKLKEITNVIPEPFVEGSYLQELPDNCFICGRQVDVGAMEGVVCPGCGVTLLTHPSAAAS